MQSNKAERAERDETERGLGLIDQIQFRPGPVVSRGVSARLSRRISPDLVAKRDLGRYYATLQVGIETVNLTADEASLICDALNGILVEEHSVRLVWADIADAIRLDGLAEKWHVDGPGLITKLQALTYTQTLAAVDAVERFWLRPNEGPDLTTQLARVGLVRPSIPATAPVTPATQTTTE